MTSNKTQKKSTLYQNIKKKNLSKWKYLIRAIIGFLTTNAILFCLNQSNCTNTRMRTHRTSVPHCLTYIYLNVSCDLLIPQNTAFSKRNTKAPAVETGDSKQNGVFKWAVTASRVARYNDTILCPSRTQTRFLPVLFVFKRIFPIRKHNTFSFRKRRIHLYFLVT